jgi:hypothetical protein
VGLCFDDFWCLGAASGDWEAATIPDKEHGNNCLNYKGGNSHGFGHSM